MTVSATTSNSDRPPARGLRGLWQRFGHLVHELGKFGVVGGVSYVVDTVILNLLLDDIGPYWAKAVSTTIAATVAFVGNRYWTWRNRPRSGLRREYLLYFIFNVVGLGIALACVWLSHTVLGHFWPGVFHTRLADNVATQVVGMALGTLFRFWAYRRYVFPTTPAEPDPVQPQPATQS